MIKPLPPSPDKAGQRGQSELFFKIADRSLYGRFDTVKGDGEIDGGVTGDGSGNSLSTIAERCGKSNPVGASGFHHLKTFGKSGDNAADREVDGPAFRAVKDSPVAETADIVDGHNVIGSRESAFTFQFDEENET